MCGIVGSISKKNNSYEIIKYGLEKLEYRGYDSAGFSYLLDNQIIVNKCKGTVEKLYKTYPNKVDFNLGIGHVRWATTGVVNDINSHPHLSYHKKICLVHNGIIENYQEIKNELIKKGYEFISQTDSEVIANLLEYYYLNGNSLLESLQIASKQLIGNYAIVLINSDEPDKLYFYKRKSPLLIGLKDDATFLASDSIAINKYTNEFIDILDDHYGFVTSNDVHIFYNGKIEEISTYKNEYKKGEDDLNGYPYFMLKEIEEIPSKLKELINTYYNDGNYIFTENLLETLKNTDYITFIGCGTSYNAEQVLSRFTNYVNIPSRVFIASEWAYYPIYFGKEPLFVLLSQSGETMDCIHCIDMIKEKGYKTLLITNSENSTLARKADFVIPLHSGREIAVASTKVYVTMIASYLLLLGAFKNNKEIVLKLESAIEAIEKVISKKEQIKNIALEIKDKKDVFFLGRGLDYYMCMEASLKLKEISYIHSEAIAAGELKHGPIALIEKDVPVFCFISDKNIASAMFNNIEEVKTRGAKVYLVASESFKNDNYHQFLVDDSSLEVAPLIKIVFGFYLAYYTSLLKGLNVDKPRNLAKSVTVE